MSQDSSKTHTTKLTDRYCVIGELGRGAMGEVHLAFPFEDPSSEVAIKIIQRSRKLGPADLLRFQKEAALMSQLHHQNIISFYELGLFDGEGDDGNGSGYYIVMEYARGYNLKTSMERDGRKDLPFFFQIGLQVAEALDYTHGKNIIHRDIKPHNIIVTEGSKDARGVLVKVLDFGVARLAEVSQSANPNQPNGNIDEQAGTPLYMAPEISAAGFGHVDHRVDLYSLGCVLYEVLTGHPPFHGSSRDALERAHQNEEPQALINLRPDVPHAIALIVHKLLAKKPDDRYQTAFALQADLLRAKGLYEIEQRKMPVFALGLKDKLFAVSAQLPLAGRQAEMNILSDEYEKVNARAGRSRMTVLSGPSGIGKSRLLTETKTKLIAKNIRFVQGVFTKHENTLPFNALANAFNETLMRTLRISGSEADELSRKIKTIVGPDAHFVATIVPGLRPYLTDLPDTDVPTKLDDSNFLKFAKSFSDFVRCLAPENQPLVFIFDDLHWADDRSLELVDQFFSNANSLKFHLVLSYQNDVAKLSPRFKEFIEKFAQLKRRFTQLNLKHLSIEESQNLIETILRTQKSIPTSILDSVYRRSNGLPMQIVEMVRQCVAQDVIKIDSSSNDWNYDELAFRNTKLRLHAIDIVLSRVSDYKDDELKILQCAAVAGSKFYFEVLLLRGRGSSVKVARVMERALEDGLILWSASDQDLSHLGKCYAFAHQKVRDAVIEVTDDSTIRNLHRQIGLTLKDLIKTPKGAQLFALTHHLNSGQDFVNEDVEYDEIRLKHNIKSGDEAIKTSSPLAAERYFEIVSDIIKRWPRNFAASEVRYEILERLADVNALQKKYSGALTNYREALGLPMPLEKKSAIAIKTIKFQLVGGLISEALKLIGVTLREVGRDKPKADWWSFVKSIFGVFWDAIDHRQQTRLVQGLMKCFKLSKSMGSKSTHLYPAAGLYQLASMAYGRNDRRLGLIAQELGIKEVLAGHAPFEEALKLVADRAAVLAMFGQLKKSYHLFDIVGDAAKRSGHRKALAYLLLRRSESVEYMNGRHEDISDQLRIVMSEINPKEDRLTAARAYAFRQYRELMRGNYDVVLSLGDRMGEIVQTRNWYSPIAKSLSLFALLIQGKRSQIVDEGGRFLRRRQSVSARMDDLFSQMIISMVTFAKGEIDPARKSFDRAVRLWIGEGDVKEMLQPWQEDFMGLFVCTYPVMFEQEYGRQVMRQEEMKMMLFKFRRMRLLRLGERRTVERLVEARTQELLGQRDKIGKAYDHALRGAKESGSVMVQLLSYMWLGIYLMDQGQTQKREYLKRAYGLAKRHQAEGLLAWIKKAAERRQLILDDQGRIDLKVSSREQGIIGEFIPPIARDALGVVALELEHDRETETVVDQLMSVLSKHHPGRCIAFLTQITESLGCIFPKEPPHDLAKIYESVSLYFNLRSTLTMHLYHASWLQDPVLAGKIGAPKRAMSENEYIDDTVSEAATKTFQADATAIIEMQKTDAAPQQASPGNRTNVDPSNVRVHGRDISGMFALVPIRFNGETIGVVLIEELGIRSINDLNATRRELDLFGVQLGAFIGHRYPVDKVLLRKDLKPRFHHHEHASRSFEDCSWLGIDFTGRMRTEREASWYLGLRFGEDQYIIAYCCLRGSARERDTFSAEIFRHLLAVRELSSMNGRNRIQIEDLRKELGGLFTREGAPSQLDEVLFSYSIFERDSPVIRSGHFGGARPLTVGSENKVEAFNQVPIQLRDGRDVRYWEVVASLSDDGIYILSFDTSKLKSQFEDVQAGKKSNLQTAERLVSLSQKYLDAAMLRNELPRYFLIVRRRSQHESQVFEKSNVPRMSRPA